MNDDLPVLLMAEATILEQHALGPGVFWMDLECPEVAEIALPGQFIHIRTISGNDPLLRRPFSFSAIDRSSGCIAILYQVIGKGTKLLSQRKQGENLDLLGPLGKPFSFRSGRQYLLGGGLGIAPLLPLARMLVEEGQDPLLLLGFRNGPDYPNALSRRITGIRHKIATEDGSVGRKGLVTGLLPEESGEDVFIYACGPRPMLSAVEAIAEKRGLQGEVSLEEHMACGIGVCKGCVTAIRGNGDRLYRRICCDGPTFPFGEVIYGD